MHLSQLCQFGYFTSKGCLLCRWYIRAGFVIWPRHNRWPVFCHQGIEAASLKLAKMLKANHKALTAHCHSEAANSACHTDVQPSEEMPDQTACKADIVSLIEGMYSHFQGCELDTVRVPGSGSFADIALAFDLHHIYVGVLGDCLEASICITNTHALTCFPCTELIACGPMSAGPHLVAGMLEYRMLLVLKSMHHHPVTHRQYLPCTLQWANPTALPKTLPAGK